MARRQPLQSAVSWGRPGDWRRRLARWRLMSTAGCRSGQPLRTRAAGRRAAADRLHRPAQPGSSHPDRPAAIREGCPGPVAAVSHPLQVPAQRCRRRLQLAAPALSCGVSAPPGPASARRARTDRCTAAQPPSCRPQLLCRSRSGQTPFLISILLCQTPLTHTVLPSHPMLPVTLSSK